MSDELKNIEARLRSVTGGPWHLVARQDPIDSRRGYLVITEAATPLQEIGRISGFNWDDARFIAAARADVDWLCNEIARLRRAD